MPQPGNGIPNGLGKETKEKTERGRIRELLERHGRHTEGKKAAGGLGISLATLYRRVGQLGLLPGKRGHDAGSACGRSPHPFPDTGKPR